MRLLLFAIVAAIAAPAFADTTPPVPDKAQVNRGAPDNHTGYVYLGAINETGKITHPRFALPPASGCAMPTKITVSFDTQPLEGVKVHSDPSPRSEIITTLRPSQQVMLIAFVAHYSACWGKIDVHKFSLRDASDQRDANPNQPTPRPSVTAYLSRRDTQRPPPVNL